MPLLTGWLDAGSIDGKPLDELHRAHVVAALGRIGDAGALPAVRSALLEKQVKVRRSAAIALGQILERADAETTAKHLPALARIVSPLERDKDRMTRHFAIMALARIGAAHAEHEAIVTDCERAIVSAFRKDDLRARAFAALAMGLLARHAPDTELGNARRKRLAKPLRAAVRELEGDKYDLAARALALGLTGDDPAGSGRLLTRILADRSMGPKLRGMTAVGIGFLPHPAGRDAVMSTLMEREDRDLRLQAADATVLLGETGAAVDRLLGIVSDPKSSQFVLCSSAMALGRIGDAHAIDRLLTIIEPGSADGEYPDLTRALSVVALGWIADRRGLQVLFRVRRDANYYASTAALDELQTIH